MKTTNEQQDIIQVYDRCLDREYYKIVGGAFISRDILVRTDRLETEKTWRIVSEIMPDRIYINNEEYKLEKIK